MYAMDVRMEDILSLLNSDNLLTKEEDLAKLLNEVRSEIEENEMVHGIPLKTPSTVPLPKDASYFKRERKLVVDRMFQVSEAKPVIVQADVHREEMMNCTKLEYTKDSLPLLLHDYFSKRMYELVQAKYLHMLRWKRFCEHTSAIESLYPYYQKRMMHILEEYRDCSERAKRLSVAREALSGSSDSAAQYVKLDDLLIYLRWLICQSHSVKKVNQYIQVLQWFHVSHKNDVTPEKKVDANDDQGQQQVMNKFSLRYDDLDLSTPARGQTSSPVTRPTSGKQPKTDSDNLDENTSNQVPPPPPLINPQIFTTHPVPASAFLMAAAAAGGGMASDNSEGLPLHCNDFQVLKPHVAFLAHIYDVESNVEDVTSTADEMEMYAAVLRVFKKAYLRQENMKTFKMYDCVDVGSQNWGADHSTHALKKDCNWLPFMTFREELDPIQEKEKTKLRHKNNIDELLRVQSNFLKINDPEKVLEVLKQHANAVREYPAVKEVSVRNHRTDHNPMQILRKIYKNPDVYTQKEDNDESNAAAFDPKDPENVNLNAAAKKGKRKDSYDYNNTVQMLGLEEGSGKDEHVSSIQGGYMSFLYLRHLRIRDLQRTCLSILNYFRSMERTLTINTEGLAQENGNIRVVTATQVRLQNTSNKINPQILRVIYNYNEATFPLGHKTNESSEGGMGSSGGISSHAYMHNTPADYKIAESEFMDFTEVENHDDFYTVEEGRVHVQDQRGYFIIYEAALEDLKKTEHELLLVATHYIEKDEKLRNTSKVSRSRPLSGKVSKDVAGGFDISGLGHTEVDRFDILLDLWTNEACFLENKKLLLDCYMESYQHVFNREQRKDLAQIMYSSMTKRPRFDFQADYFLSTYRLESICLRQKANLIKNVLNTQIEDCRQYIQKVCRDIEGNSEIVFGLPFSVIPHQPISLNMSNSALKNCYMLEYHPSLGLTSKIPEALDYTYWELHQIHKPETVTDMLEIEKRILELAVKEWEDQPIAGSSFTSLAQKQLFSGVFIEDPLFLCEVAQALVTKQEQQGARKTKKERQAETVSTVGSVMELVTLRHRMIDASWETEILSKIYKKLTVEMGYDECHLFMRFLQFEYAVRKEDAGKPPPLRMTVIQDDDSGVDRLVPKDLPLAIHELDEGGLGRFTFRSREGVLNLLKESGTANFQVVTMAQVLHKNALIAAVQQMHACGVNMKAQHGEAFNLEGAGRMSPTDTKSEKSSLTMLTGFSAGTKGDVTSTTKLYKDGTMRSPEAFVSIQMEKSPSRDVMLNEFLDKKRSAGMALKNVEELDKMKRILISGFCLRFINRISQYSLRGQIITHYNGILNFLQQFPNIKDTYFVIGEPNEKKSENDTIAGLESDPRTLKKRPRRVISKNGEHVLNLWFIPHHSEVLMMFKHLDDIACVHALTNMCKITGALHDITQYLCAHSKLGSGQALLGSRKVEFVSADWGGTEGIGAELREIQKQVDNLINPTDPGTVAKFLQLRRDVMFLIVDTAIRHSMRDTFLASGNSHAYQAITKSLHFALPHMSSVVRPSLLSTYMSVPDPLEATDAKAKSLLPWHSFINRNGPYPTSLWQSHRIEHNLQTCLCGLKDVDRHVSNGEILGVSLLLEDILQTGNQDSNSFIAIAGPIVDDDTKSKKSGSSRPTSSYSMVSAGRSTQKMRPSSISRTKQPIEAYELLKHFLLLWKRVEVLKMDWGLRRLRVNKIHTPQLHKLMCKEYKEQKLFPVLQSIARRTGHGDMYEGITHDVEPLIMPPNVSEIEIKVAQLLKLIESVEEFMIVETMKKLTKDLNLAYAERGREEGALPTDLWKKPNWKENFTVKRPEIAEQFAQHALRGANEQGDSYIIPKAHWDESVKQLASQIMAREKFDYESYTSYYEGLLKTLNQNLYKREQENKQIKDHLQSLQSEVDIEVQCRLAEKNQDLIIEVTALRAQVSEMREYSLVQERTIRERQREEYNGLVQNLHQACYTLKQRLDEYREEIYDDVCKKVLETSREADQNIDRKLAQKHSITVDTDQTQRQQDKIMMEDLRSENFELTKLVSRMKVMQIWKLNYQGEILRTEISKLESERDSSQKKGIRSEMLAEEQIILLRQQILALRKALADSEKEAGDMRKKLDKELKTRKEKLYTAMQQAANQRQLELAKQTNVDELLEALEQKEKQMQVISAEQERHMRIHQMSQEKSKKDVHSIKKQLHHERNLKLDAFQRVDELQATVYDIATHQKVIRAQTALGVMANPAVDSPMQGTSVSATRAVSAAPATRARSAASGGRMRRSNLTMTKDSTLLNNQSKSAGLQRPKTSTGRLRSRIAEQLLNDLERDPQDVFESVQKLQERAAFMTEVNRTK